MTMEMAILVGAVRGHLGGEPGVHTPLSCTHQANCNLMSTTCGLRGRQRNLESEDRLASGRALGPYAPAVQLDHALEEMKAQLEAQETSVRRARALVSQLEGAHQILRGDVHPRALDLHAREAVLPDGRDAQRAAVLR